jgi:hypothetical protein
MIKTVLILIAGAFLYVYVAAPMQDLVKKAEYKAKTMTLDGILR